MFLWAQRLLRRAMSHSKTHGSIGSMQPKAASLASGRPAQHRHLASQRPDAATLHKAELIYTVVPSPGHFYDAHVESPARVLGVLQSLAAAGLRGEGSATSARATELPADRLATPEELAAVHRYAQRLLRQTVVAGQAQVVADLGDPDGVTFLTATSIEDARRAAGAALALVDAVMDASPITGEQTTASGDGTPSGSGEAGPPSAPSAFGIIRPPGHHATPDTPLGYCIFNNVALAARYAQQRYGLQRVLIVDFDVHNGNGTCEIFWDDPSVLVVDAHEASSIYPEPDFVPAGAADTGAGAGKGYTINIPLPRYAGHDAIVAAFRGIVAPAARRFAPNIILVSAGYDAHVHDPFQLLQYRSSTYHALAGQLRELARELCGGRLIFLLEGGYDVAALGESVVETWLALLGQPSVEGAQPAALPEVEPVEEAAALIAQLREIHKL